MPVNDAGLNSLMEAERLGKVYMTEQISRWTNMYLSQIQIIQTIIPLLRKADQNRITGNVNDGYRMVAQKPAKPSQAKDDLGEMTVEIKDNKNGQRKEKVKRQWSLTKDR